ncbi:MAG: KH domain-containing protein [Candidatus Micrarchaeia archaeon]|jgi:exosome complex component RRP4
MEIVVPGDMILDKPMHMENTFIEDNKTYSAVLGMFDKEKKILIPLEGLWYPKHGELVVGIIVEERLSSYVVDLNAPYKGILVAKYVRDKLSVGDIIEATVKELDETKTVVLMREKKLYGGKIIDVKPSKVPRIIGKNNTMIKQLTEGTKSTIIVGMNGRIWIKGGDVSLTTKAILRIQEEAHTSGLTDRIREMLEKSKKTA